MKCKQDQKFQPITIILETPEEAIAVWDAIGGWRQAGKVRQKIAEDMSNWFSNNAQLIHGQ